MQYLIGPWLFSPARCLLTCKNKGEERELEPLIFKLLTYFIAQQERIISRQELVEQVWQQSYVDDNAINRAISELRKQLKHPTEKAQLIKTHYRKGYSLAVAAIPKEANQDISAKQAVFQQTTDGPYEEQARAAQPAMELSEANTLEKQATPRQALNHQDKDTRRTPGLRYGLITLVALMLIACFFYLLPVIKEDAAPAANRKQLDEGYQTQSKPLSYAQEMLSWQQGSSSIPKLSKDQQLLAYAFTPANSNKESLYIKNMTTLTEHKLLESEGQLFPVGWSEDNDFFYQVYDLINKEKCELWQVNLNGNFEQSQHKKLFNCIAVNIISADTAGNKLLYTKYNYRDKTTTSAIVSRDLTSGHEFQVTSPNITEQGDYFVKIANNQDKLLFLRYQADGTQIFISDIDGSNQYLVFTLDYYVGAINWHPSDSSIFWLDYEKRRLLTYNLDSQQLTEEKKIGRASCRERVYAPV